MTEFSSPLLAAAYGPLPVHISSAVKIPKGVFWIIEVAPSRRAGAVFFWVDELSDKDQPILSVEKDDAAKFKTMMDAVSAWNIRGRWPLNLPDCVRANSYEW